MATHAPSTAQGQIDLLLGQIESLVLEGTRVPLTARVMIDAEQLLNIVELIRQSLPAELAEAERIVSERNALVADAREEAENLVAQAHEMAAKLTQESAIVLEAQERADELTERARATAQEIRLRAVEYADEVLERLEQHVDRTLDTVRRHREDLRR